jgi:hypothetical protein
MRHKILDVISRHGASTLLGENKGKVNGDTISRFRLDESDMGKLTPHLRKAHNKGLWLKKTGQSAARECIRTATRLAATYKWLFSAIQRHRVSNLCLKRRFSTCPRIISTAIEAAKCRGLSFDLRWRMKNRRSRCGMALGIWVLPLGGRDWKSNG